MRKLFFLVMLLCLNSVVIGCSPKETFNEQNLTLQISKSEGQSYTVYKKIEDKETVKKVMDILLNASWENAKVSMSRQPDYKIETINTDPTVSYEPVIYDIWLSPIKDILEVVIDRKSKYGKLSKEGSKTLKAILQGINN